jgi:hypothetical protein
MLVEVMTKILLEKIIEHVAKHSSLASVAISALRRTAEVLLLLGL